MNKLIVFLITIVPLSLFSIPSYAIADDYNSLPTLEEYYEQHPEELGAQTRRDFEILSKSDWKKITRETPTEFNLKIDGKSKECHYEGKDIICN